MKRFFCLLTLTFLTASGHAFGGDYLPVTGPCALTFPRDHGAHPGYRTEWWYYTGNVAARSGARYGFQLTFFRTQLSPPGAEKDWPRKPSAWRTNQLFFLHAAISDLDGGQFFQTEQMARGALGLSGVEADGATARVFLGGWSALLGPKRHRLRGTSSRFSLDLTCRPRKPPIPHGTGGYSLKGRNPESASCYYSFSRLETFGTLTIGGNRVKVRGTAWMDHEFSSAPLESDLVGWDWFSIQLADNRELMIYLLRDRRGDHSPSSSGTFILGGGAAHHLTEKDFRVEVLDSWKSPHTGTRYPSKWRVRVFPFTLDLLVVPNLADQELITEGTTQVTYWEGSISAKGTMMGKDIKGLGYVELTGYKRPFNLPQ